MKNNKVKNSSFLDEIKKNGLTMPEDIFSDGSSKDTSYEEEVEKGLTIPPDEDEDGDNKDE